MKYLIMGLCFFLFTGQAFSKQILTGYQLVRFVCEEEDIGWGSEYILILEQISSKTLNRDSAMSETIDGSAFIDLGSDVTLTDDGEFRLRIYDKIDGKTKEQMIEDFMKREADLDFFNRPMDYVGKGYRSKSIITFESTGPYSFIRSMNVYLDGIHDGISGGVSTTNAGRSMKGDELYLCDESVFVPEMTEEQ